MQVSAVEAPGSDWEAMVAILREHGMRAEIAVAPEWREHLGCAQIRLESAFVEAKPFACFVFVRRVDLDPQQKPRLSQGIVKFSPRQFSPATHESVQLGTAPYYRGYEGEGPGVQDPDEGVYRESLDSYFGKYNPEAVDMLGSWSQTFTIGDTTLTVEAVLSGSVTYQPDAHWLYCTAYRRGSQSERALMQGHYDGDCMTALGGPSEFARELGSAFARLSPPPTVSLDDPFHRLQHEMLRSQTPPRRIVYVNHGPVVYTNSPQSFIEAVPLQCRAAAVPFFKGVDYADQKEYRFSVSTTGTPTKNLLAVPITAELRSLSRIAN